MKKIEVNLYNYEELSDKAKEKALNDWNETNNDPLMQSHMINLLGEKLEERGIVATSDPDVRYSLSNSQGDGFMFLGSFEFKGNQLEIEHSGHYYHSNSKQITWINFSGEEKEQEEEKIAEEFEEIYQSICNEMEKIGYDYIEYEQSEENFIGICDANEYTFEADGTMRNAE